jgi:proline dehydrogenase
LGDFLTFLRNFIFKLSTKKRFTDAIARRGMKRGFARRFVAGGSLEEALAPAADLCRAGRRVIFNQLGEHIAAKVEAYEARDSYLRTLHAIDEARLDANISIKLTQLGLTLDRELCLELTDEIAAAAKSLLRTIEIDMEASEFVEATIATYESAQRRHGNVGLAIQSYLRRSERDLERLAGLGPKIRLVKGAYREPASVALQEKSEVDANYRVLLEQLLRPSANGRFFAAIGTHDPALIEFAKAKIHEYAVTSEHYEFQMIYGIRRDLQRQLIEAGHPLRVYVPFGTAWVPYFMRRLSERPANLWFVVRSLIAEHKPAGG